MRAWGIEREAYGIKNGCWDLQTACCWGRRQRESLGNELE